MPELGHAVWLDSVPKLMFPDMDYNIKQASEVKGLTFLVYLEDVQSCYQNFCYNSSDQRMMIRKTDTMMFIDKCEVCVNPVNGDMKLSVMSCLIKHFCICVIYDDAMRIPCLF